MNEDGSGPARKRLRTINIDEFNVPDVDVRDRHKRTPAVDWTGHQYKAPKDCKSEVPRVKLGRIIGA